MALKSKPGKPAKPAASATPADAKKTNWPVKQLQVIQAMVHTAVCFLM